VKYQAEITKIIKNTVSLTQSVESIEIETPLEGIGMDSMSFIQLVVAIEDAFEIDFPDEKLNATQVGTIKALCETVYEIKDTT